MAINWKVRAKNKSFWVGVIGAVGTCVMVAANAMGVTIDVDPWVDAANGIVTSVFTVLALLGVVADPTTQGIGDSALALTYTAPKQDAVVVETKSE